MIKDLSVKDIEGSSKGSAETGLLQRCKESWETPLSQLSDLMVTTYLNQKIALAHMIQEAEHRLATTARDDTELFDDQLAEALQKAQTNQRS